MIAGHGERRLQPPASAVVHVDARHAPPAPRLLDLFSGLGGWSQPFRDLGWDVRTLDIDPGFEATYCMDIRRFADDPHAILDGWVPDVITASPDCRGFATIARAWRRASPQRKDPRRVAVSETARLGVELVEATRAVLEALRPRFWVLENPTGMLRKTDLLAGFPRRTVDYCQYGAPYQKPTDLWGVLPSTWMPRPRCPAFRTRGREACPVHVPGGLLSVSNSAQRAVVPYELGEDLARCIETYDLVNL